MVQEDGTDGAEEAEGAEPRRATSGTGGERRTGSLPQVDFSTFVLSLGTTALYQMGLVADPTTGERGEGDLPAAQQTVDTLEMLREKTLGNLDEDERKLIDSLLYELRMRFVETRR